MQKQNIKRSKNVRYNNLFQSYLQVKNGIKNYEVTPIRYVLHICWCFYILHYPIKHLILSECFIDVCIQYISGLDIYTHKHTHIYRFIHCV